MTPDPLNEGRTGTPALNADANATPKMPPVWRGGRRWLIVGLVVLGVAQAVLALVMAFSVDALLSAAGLAASPDVFPWGGMSTLVAAVLGIGLARWLERIVAERLGQNYVYEQRRRLITSALGELGNRSLGVIVTRASNDLTAVRNWIAQGIVPLATALPLIITVIGVLALTNWPVAVAIFVPLGVMALMLPFLSVMAHNRARTLRRYRGRMSAHIADTVRAGESIRVAGAMRRELNAVDRNSARVVDAAVARARVTGFVRSLTVTAASLCTAAVVVIALLGVIDVAEVASIMTLLGVMSTPLSDLGRVVEYRQNYRAARRILAPMLSAANELKRQERRREKAWKASKPKRVPGHRGLTVERLSADGVELPSLDAVPGDRIHLESAHPAHVRAAIRSLLDVRHDADGSGADGSGADAVVGSGAESADGAGRNAEGSGAEGSAAEGSAAEGSGDGHPEAGHSVAGHPEAGRSGDERSGSAPGADDPATNGPNVLVDGFDLLSAPGKKRRELVGFASDRVPLERGSIQRLVSYRNPDTLVGEVRWALHRVGLGPLVERSSNGLKSKLKNDGSPWNSADVARLKLARALLGTPPLLVLEHIDSALDESGRETLREILDSYPGVVLFVSQRPELIVSGYRQWHLDGMDEESRAFTAAMIGRAPGVPLMLEPEDDE